MRRDHVFLDTSVFVKLLVEEPDSDAYRQAIFPPVSRLTPTGIPIVEVTTQLYISKLTEVEFTSAIYRKLENGRLTREQTRAIFESFDLEFVGRVPVTDWTFERASQLLHQLHQPTPTQSIPLRTLDAVQLASALLSRDLLDRFFVADVKLRAAFERVGLPVTKVTPDA